MHIHKDTAKVKDSKRTVLNTRNPGGRRRQGDREFGVSMGYTVGLSHKKTKIEQEARD